jgi:hypothetical protein
MKKKIFTGIAILTIAVLSAWNVTVNSQKSELSELSLANIEALANAGNCNWATREVYNGWEAICILDGPGFSCWCGIKKLYPN